MKKIGIIIMCLFLVCQIKASDRNTVNTMQGQTESWLKKSDNTSQTGNDRSNISAPTTDPVIPVGNGMFILMLLAGGYCIWKQKSLKKQVLS
jgi:hypothetical protein